MRPLIIRMDEYKRVGQFFHWALAEHYIRWFLGENRRHKRTEVVLPRLVRMGKLRAVKYGAKLAYAVPRISKGQWFNLDHGLGCTEGLVRIYRSDLSGVPHPEKEFRGLGVIPEWGMEYPERGTMLLYEFCTPESFSRPHEIEGKTERYNTLLYDFEIRFPGRTFTVLFVIARPRQQVKEWVERHRPGGRFYFTDYASFERVLPGYQLTVPIYFWGSDATVQPLRRSEWTKD